VCYVCVVCYFVPSFLWNVLFAMRDRCGHDDDNGGDEEISI
jgi:hypothetical protein